MLISFRSYASCLVTLFLTAGGCPRRCCPVLAIGKFIHWPCLPATTPSQGYCGPTPCWQNINVPCPPHPPPLMTEQLPGHLPRAGILTSGDRTDVLFPAYYAQNSPSYIHPFLGFSALFFH